MYQEFPCETNLVLQDIWMDEVGYLFWSLALFISSFPFYPLFPTSIMYFQYIPVVSQQRS